MIHELLYVFRWESGGMRSFPSSLSASFSCSLGLSKTRRLLNQLGSPPAFDFSSAGFPLHFPRPPRLVTRLSLSLGCQMSDQTVSGRWTGQTWLPGVFFLSWFFYILHQTFVPKLSQLLVYFQ